MVRFEFKLKNGCIVRIDDSLAVREDSAEGQRIAREQCELVNRMMHRRFRANAQAREDMEYDGVVDDEPI